MPIRNLTVIYRLFFGLLTFVAIGTQLVIHLQNHLNVVNFFSFFTNLSNLFAATVLLIGCRAVLLKRKSTKTEDIIRGTSVVCMVIVGIVFSLLLRDVDLGHLQPWVNTVLHYIMPVAVVLDWLLWPPKSKLRFAQVGYWLLFPFIYLVYTLIRGAIVGFYPCPFLTPSKVGGYAGVAVYSVAILGVFLACSWLLMVVSNRRQRVGR